MPETTEPLDPAAIMADHQPNAVGKCRGCPGGYAVWPCEPYRWAADSQENIAVAERRGAVKALRAAARVPHNGAEEFVGPRGRVHPQSLYNEGAAPWLDGMADAIENGADW